MKKRGFTLIELTVVLLILGIVAAAVTLKMAGPVSRMKLQDVVERVRQFDSHTRSYARQNDKALRVEIDLAENSIFRFDEITGQIGRELELPSGFNIEECRTITRQKSTDTTLLKYSSQGVSRSYALKLADKLHSKWILIIGLSGEVVELEDEIEVQKILQSLSRDDTG